MKQRTCFAIKASLLMLVVSTSAQTSSSNSEAASPSTQVPHLIRFSGIARDEAGRPTSGVLGMTFALYQEEQGGTPVWLETQNVRADTSGHYTVMLGSSKPEGLPLDVFTSGEARWLGIQVQGQTAEQVRVLLVSVPYALEAGDAETLGGMPASAFVQTASNPGQGAAAVNAGAKASARSGSTSVPAASISGSGTTNFIPIWTSSTTLGNSTLFQTGGNVGLGTTTPGAKLDVTGTGSLSVRGKTSSATGNGVLGIATATTGATTGVGGFTNSSTAGANGVLGGANAATGVTFGVQGFSNSSSGVGVQGSSPNNGIAGFNQTCNSTGCTIHAGIAGRFVTATGGTLLQGLSGSSLSSVTQVFSVDASGNGSFAGNLNVKGTVTKGGGSFKIDDPLDPAHKFLSHSFVESPDMMNIYNGNVTTDKHGLATVMLPDYFEALNRDFRYQLTVIGQFAQAVVARKIADNRFVIRTNKPRVEVSWQVTGIRHDAYANAYRIPVEEEKPPQEQGHYLHPELFSAGGEEAIGTGATPPQVSDSSIRVSLATPLFEINEPTK